MLFRGIASALDEQPLKITAAVHTFNIFCYSSEGHIFLLFGAIRQNWLTILTLQFLNVYGKMSIIIL